MYSYSIILKKEGEFMKRVLFLCACVSALALPKMSKAADIVLEAESFTLKNAEVVADNDASGKKAIRLLTAEAEATLDVTLEPGSYIMTVWEKSPDGSHDAFYAGVGDDNQRFFPDKYNVWQELGKVLEFTVDKAGKKTVKIAVNWPGVKKKGEDGMLIDKIVIKKK
jgi:hypothetical protein